jgi:hypothetical protein
MEPNVDKNPAAFVAAVACEQQGPVQSSGSDQFKLRRWLVSFASGREWHPVGEFVAVDATSAMDRAIEIFGAASGNRAEEIPWDAAPLPRPKPRKKHN